MNWEATGAIAELLGATGVIASLIYLASQIRHSTRQSFAASYQSRAELSAHIFGELSMSYGLPEIEVKARSLDLPADSARLDELTPIEVSKLRSYYTAVANHFDNMYFQYEQGLIPTDYYEEVFIPATINFAKWWQLLGLLDQGVFKRRRFEELITSCLTNIQQGHDVYADK